MRESRDGSRRGMEWRQRGAKDGKVGAWQTQRRLRSTEFRVQITDLKGMR